MGQSVLVAEDDPSVRMTIEFVLSDEGFDVLLAEDGEQALSIALASKPDVILLDQIMPKMDGKEVLLALRANEATREIPVLVLTGMARGDSSEWPGATFVGKPFSPDTLVQRIREVLGARPGTE
ncbi:MAG: two-component system, OmpR family, alkaline phosphatase synthesis response regulator PhoP [Actinomycetota bacterium]|jgi:DNA-binding response OmpR family regulator|nr:two-component system, OmpR family, alkaline phosphatase synthesis response regulator PhoP [Actinomycetota bacterium]